MRKISGAIFLAYFAVMLLGCGDNIGPNPPVKTLQISQTEQEILDANNAFGFELFRTLIGNQQIENTVISPVSISMALGMTLNGAETVTYDSMRNVLGFEDFTREEINRSYRNLIDQLLSLDPNVTMEIANSIWISDDYSVKSSFKDVNRTNFDAEIRNLDFSLPSSVDEINGWVADKTHDRITEVIDQIDPMVLMYLINALYFNGTWTYEFDDSETREAPFQVADGTEVTADMMVQTNTFDYFSNDNVQVVDLPYGNEDFSMTIVLPKGETTIGEFVSSLSADLWSSLILSLEEQEGTVYLPRFEIAYDTLLNDPLTAMGMANAFSPGDADFSGISELVDLFINRVIHKTYIRVDEAGTEAAGVTVVETYITSVGGNGFIMRIDRPFLLAIRERTSGAVLFLGVIDQPERIS